MRSFADDRSELAIGAACYGGEVFEVIVTEVTEPMLGYFVDAMTERMRRLADRAGFEGHTPWEMRWGADNDRRHITYCLAWFLPTE